MGFNRILINSLILFSFFISCKKEEKSGKAEDDGLIRQQLYRLENVGWKSKIHTEFIGGINFSAVEVPVQYYLLKDKGNQDLFLIDSIYQENKKERIIEFTFTQEDEEDLLKEKFTTLNYEDGIKYLAFSIDKDFYAVTSKNDTILCSGAQYERNFKIAPFQKLILFFSGIEPEEEIQLIYKDKLFGKGIIKFQFKDTYTEIPL